MVASAIGTSATMRLRLPVMRVLVACEQSGTVRDAFRRRGHNAWSCDILPDANGSPFHYQQDVTPLLEYEWDLMIAHPPCTDLAVSGAKHFHRKAKEQEEGLAFVAKLAAAPNVHRICIENPVSIISTRLGPPDQIIQPWQFGDEAQKTTCLWLHWLPPLIPTSIVDKGEFWISPDGKKRMPKWMSDNTSPKHRSKTFQGIADAMADQWGIW